MRERVRLIEGKRERVERREESKEQREERREQRVLERSESQDQKQRISVSGISVVRGSRSNR